MPIDLLGQVYLVSFFVGAGFLVFNAFIGQLGHGAHSIGIHILNDPQLGHVSHSTTIHSGHAVSTQHSNSISNHTSTITRSLPANNYVPGSLVEKLRRRLLLNDDSATRLGIFIISSLSPMRFAIWCTFFGLIGFFTQYFFPFPIYLSLIPAVFISMFATRFFDASLSWAVDYLQAPPVHSNEDLVGTIASVITPVSANKTGEIIYVVDSARYHSPAKLASEESGTIIARGTKVMILGMEKQVALVESVKDPLLLENPDEGHNRF